MPERRLLPIRKKTVSYLNTSMRESPFLRNSPLEGLIIIGVEKKEQHIQLSYEFIKRLPDGFLIFFLRQDYQKNLDESGQVYTTPVLHSIKSILVGSRVLCQTRASDQNL